MPVGTLLRTTITRGLFLGLLGAAPLLALAQSDPGLLTIRADALKGHIYFLASDEMGGRDSMSAEGRIAAQYIAGFFHRYGLKPVGDAGTFLQNFPMVEAHLDRDASYLRARLAPRRAAAAPRRATTRWAPISPWDARVTWTWLWLRRSSLPVTASRRPSIITMTSPVSTSPARL